MKKYKNLGGNSGVNMYENGNDFIRVMFNDGSIYKYTYTSAGIDYIEEAKNLADCGQGLNSFIMTNMRKLYESKE
jgi:hypothetical protein